MSVDSLLATDAELTATFGRQAGYGICGHHILRDVHIILRRLVSTVPRLLAGSHKQYSMHDGFEPFDHQFVVQFVLRPHDNGYPAAAIVKTKAAVEEETPYGVSIQPRLLHYGLRDPVQGLELQGSLFCGVGLLVRPRK